MCFKLFGFLIALALLPLAYFVVLSGQWLLALAMFLVSIILVVVVVFGAGVRGNNINVAFGGGDVNANVDIHHRLRSNQRGTLHRDKSSQQWMSKHDDEGGN